MEFEKVSICIYMLGCILSGFAGLSGFEVV